MSQPRLKSFSTKLLVYGVVISAVSVALVCAASVTSELLGFRDAALDRVSAHADVIAMHSAAALQFDDVAIGEQTLTALRAVSGVRQAAIYQRDGRLFASFGEKGNIVGLRKPGHTFDDEGLVLARAIRHEGNDLGTLVVRYSMAQHYDHLMGEIGMSVAVGALSMATAIVIGLHFRRRLLKPISELGQAARQIAATDDYSIRAEKYDQDELGDLTDVFNEMLERVQRKDAQLAKLNADLEDRVADRTCELERALVDANAASRAKSDFLANMSHEIRTPMTAILGFADLLRHDHDDAEERMRHVQTIQRSGKHLLTLINDILDLSKIEAGKMTAERVRCSPAQILEEVATTMYPLSASKNLHFRVRSHGQIPQQVWTDPTRLRQILVNLVGNAIKFTESGHVDMVVRVESANSPGTPRLVFEVTDSGIGMTETQISRLFDPFTQADASTTRKFGGTGLGLTISRRLTRLLGGDLTVRSALGIGSTFRVEIDPGDLSGVAFHPVNVRNAREVHDAAEVDQVTDESARPLRGIRVLVAEDGPDNQVLISRMLDFLGATARIVDNGQMACDLLERRELHFDVVLMDMQMPEMDGYTAATRIRAAGVTLPIIALTAHTMSGDRDLCLQAGCDDYATKPINMRSLVSIIHRWAGADDATLSADDLPDPDLSELRMQFLSELPERVENIRRLREGGLIEEVGQEAHRLIGAAGAYDIHSLVDASRHLERVCMEDAASVESIRSAIAELDRCVRMCRREARISDAA